MTFQIYTPESAPAAARENLKNIEMEKGFVPNILGVFAGSPAVLEAFIAMEGFMKKMSFTPTERELIFLTISHKNGSTYCLAAHSKNAEKNGVSKEMVRAIYEGGPLDSPRLEALRQYTLGVVENRGRPTDKVIDNFLDAGYHIQKSNDTTCVSEYQQQGFKIEAVDSVPAK